MAKKVQIQESDVLQLLKVLDKKELKLLKENMAYQLFTINAKQQPLNMKLFEEIMAFAPKFENAKLTKEFLFANAFGKTAKYNDSMLNKRLADVKQAINQFIVMNDMQQEEQEIQSLLRLLKFLKKKPQLNHLFVETQTKIKKRLEKKWTNTNINPTTYYESYLFYGELLGHESFRDEQILNFKQTLYYLEFHFLCEQLDYYCHFVNMALSSGKKAKHYDIIYFQHLSKILEDLPQQRIFKEPMIQMYYAAWQMLKDWKNDDGSLYENYKNLLLAAYPKNPKLRNFEILSPHVQQNLFGYAQNYCTWKSKTTENAKLKEKYALEQLDLYEIQLNQATIKEIQPNLMRNIMLRMKDYVNDYERLENFVATYVGRVEKKHKEAVSNYCLAIIAFEKQSYETVLQLLVTETQIIRFPNEYFKLDAYRLVLKTLVETEQKEKIETIINRFRVYLNDDYKNKALFDKHKRFIIYLNRLLTAIEKNDETAFHDLKRSINNMQDTVDTKWLLQKVEDEMI